MPLPDRLGHLEHPSTTAGGAGPRLSLVEFTAFATAPGRLRAWLAALGVADDVVIRAASSCWLSVTLRGPSARSRSRSRRPVVAARRRRATAPGSAPAGGAGP